MAAEFEVMKNAGGKFYWRFKTGNGEIVAHSEAYETKQGCLNGINSVKKEAAAAKVNDMTG